MNYYTSSSSFIYPAFREKNRCKNAVKILM